MNSELVSTRHVSNLSCVYIHKQTVNSLIGVLTSKVVINGESGVKLEKNHGQLDLEHELQINKSVRCLHLWLSVQIHSTHLNHLLTSRWTSSTVEVQRVYKLHGDSKQNRVGRCHEETFLQEEQVVVE